MELLMLTLVFLSPWPFGAIDPPWAFWLYLGIGALLVLWAMRVLNRGSWNWAHCPIALCLAGFILLASWQLIPLPNWLLKTVSPATAQLYGRLLPSEPEQLVVGVNTEPSASTGATISVYSHATRRAWFHLLAILVVYVVVRNNLAGPGYARRFSICGLVCGAALALFSLIQFFSSPPNVIYWSGATQSAFVFGPFICRNHFPFYVNICFGLGLGLLFSQWTGRQPQVRGICLASVFALLRQPQVLWIVTALILMATSVAFSLSRGGVLALLGGMASLPLFVNRSVRLRYLMPSFLIAACSLGLLAWFGLGRVEARLGTLLQDKVLKDIRVSLLTRAPALVKDYPLWGTGFGSLDYVEPISRTDAAYTGLAYEHAHNEYLEAQIEGGFAALTLMLLLTGLVYRQGFRAYRRWQGRSAQGLVLGMLVGFTTLTLHNFVDFGIHIPAIALLATVLCAHLSSLSEGPGQVGIQVPEYGSETPRWMRRLSPLAGAAAFVFLGLLLMAEGYRGKETSQAFLEEAVRLDPDDAHLHFDDGKRRAAVFETLASKQREQETMLDAVQAVLLVNPDSGTAGPSSFVIVAGILKERENRIIASLAEQHLTPALGHFLRARDLCPARAMVHLEIASYREHLQRSEPRSNYLDRALYLEPTNQEIWYRAGVLQLRDEQLDQAAKDWRRSLELSDTYLTKILAQSASRFTSEELLDRVLPNKPGILVAAAAHLYPKQPQERGPFYAKARRLLQETLKEKPFDVESRYQLASLLFQEEQFQETRQELLTVLAIVPGHVQARALLIQAEREIGKGQRRRADLR
jgi:O-antigen ligase